jgi:hypothetical protein
LNAAAFLKHFGLEELKGLVFSVVVNEGLIVVDLNQASKCNLKACGYK